MRPRPQIRRKEHGVITLERLTKTYGSTTVLDNLDLVVPTGEITAVVGPSGAGKSTLARCVNLLERPSSGSITVDGRDLTALSGVDLRTARREIGTVFQSANLLRRLTAAQNVALPLRHHGVPEAQVRRRVHELLERVGIARGLALQPSLLLSDEATSGLDPDTTHSILALLRELRDDLGVTILVITHEMDVVRGIADHVAQLDHGRIIEEGPVADVVRRSDSHLSRALLPLPPAAPAPDGLREWNLRYETAAVSPFWLSRASRELAAEIAVLAAVVEESGESTVGRLCLALQATADDHRIRSVFGSLGIAAHPRANLQAVEADGQEPAA
jgi:D-methionine transport system ATP-binding protein